MKFRLGQRVRVTKPISKGPSIEGRTGTVVRLLRRSSEEAWIEMDEDLPIDLQCFKDDARRRHICLYDDEVEVIKA